MKRFIINSILALAAIFAAISCTQEPIDPNPYEEGPALLAFAPNPVYRGGILTFVGSHLDKVTEVQIPGIDPITEINVETAGAKSRISVTLPNTTEEVGLITLVTSDGSKLVSKTELTYTEPIVFEDFSPKDAMPGDVITVTGDYMNLVAEVIFAGDAYAVGEAISDQTRKELKVVVPDNAISGRFILGDSDEVANPDNVANKIYSEGELTIGDPTVTSLGEITPKAGDVLTISGKYLSMIASASVSGVAVEPEIEAGENHGVKALITVPETAADGDIVLTSYAGKEFVAGTIETIVPTNLAIAAETFKAGLTATISGDDLDLVTDVNFGGATCEFTYDEETGKIDFTISEKSVDGAAVLTLANGKTVETEEVELVKPAISAISPLEITAGDSFTVEGTDLDLVTGVKLGGKDEEFTLSEEGVITVTTSATSVAGVITLTLANGVTVESEDKMVVNYDSFIVVNEMPEAEHIGAIVTFKGSNFLMIENILIGEAKVTKYIVRTDDEIQFLMPYNKIGTYSITFNLTTGESEVCPKQIEVLLEQYFTTAWEGETEITWGDGGRVAVPVSAFAGVSAGAKLRLYYTQKQDTWAQAQINNGAWAAISFPEVPGGTLIPTDVYGWFADGILDRVTELSLTADVLDNIKTNAGDYEGVSCGIIIQGSDLIFTKVEIVGEISQEIVLWEGEATATGWGDQPYLLSDAGVELSNAGAEVGQEVRFYISPLAAGDLWKLQIVEGHWGATYCSYCALGADTEDGKFTEWDLDANGGYIPLTLTEEILTAALTQQWWGGTFIGNGDLTKITKITLF